MSIRCVCRNGHVLNVKDKFAGNVGLCPLCKVRVEVPRPHADMSEDAILDLLGKQPVTASETATISATATVADCGEFGLSSLSGIHGKSTPKKCCERCNQEVEAGTHICPFCHTYIANLSDF